MEIRLEIPVSEHQERFLQSRALIRAFVGGRGSGKTWIGAFDLIIRAMKRPGLYGVYAPTYPMLEDGPQRTVLEHAEMLRCLRRFNRNKRIVTLTSGSELLLRSLDDPERARGANLSGAWMDEASLMTPDAYLIVLGTLRGGGPGQKKMGWLSMTFTPKGKKHWTYEVCTDKSAELIQASTGSNPFLPAEFEEKLRSLYPSRFARQEIGGEFLEPEGAVFRREWFIVEESAPEGLHWARYWDLAVSTKQTADYTASIAAAMDRDGTVWLRDLVRGKWEWPDQEKIIVQVALSEPNTVVGIEKAVHGLAAVQALLRRPELAHIAIWGIDVDKDKLSRALPLAARAEAGKVRLVRGQWIGTFLDELCAFTGDGTTHDDQVDAASGALRMLAEPREAQSAPSIWL